MRSKRLRNRKTKGQAVVEYSAVIAFVCVMIAMAFRIAQGTLFAGISNSYSHVNGNLQALNQAALNAGQ